MAEHTNTMSEQNQSGQQTETPPDAEASNREAAPQLTPSQTAALRQLMDREKSVRSQEEQLKQMREELENVKFVENFPRRGAG